MKRQYRTAPRKRQPNNGLDAKQAATFLSLLYQPRLRVLLATLGRDDVQSALERAA